MSGLCAGYHSQASHHKSQGQTDSQPCGGVQIPHGPHGDHKNDDVREDIWNTAIPEKGFLVNTVRSRYFWIPIGCKRPTGGKTRSDRCYRQCDKNADR